MKGNYLIILLAIFVSNVLSELQGSYCFNYTWPASSVDEKNCTKHNERNPYTPCATPYDSVKKPNTTELWRNSSNEEYKKYFCPLEADNVCIRYTYMYNSAIVNVTYFCGKVVEDRTMPITSGCYTQHTEGFTIEVYVCQNKNNMPCNTAIKNTCIGLVIIMATVISLSAYKIF
ncbi:hypothetical protein HN011_006936 [Eciton burchellii]|nr:hypothetical protein HN011_006936 [Eciton burchellii]